MAASPFDGTVDALAAVVSTARARGDRMGEFAAMYGAVTRRVRMLASQGAFDDADRMAAFVETFALRFLDASAAWGAGRPVTRSWQVAFDAGSAWRPTVLQHLLLGMTAHIGLDLGIVAAQVATAAGGRGLEALRPDFIAVNDVLAAMVPEVESAVGDLSPAMGLLDRLGGRADGLAVTRVIAVARELAWRTATDVVREPESARASVIDGVDTEVAEWSRTIAHPGPIMSSALLTVRLLERRSVAESIDRLGAIEA